MSLGDTKKMIFDIIAKDHASTTFDKVSRSTGGSARGMSGWKKAAVGGLVAATGAAVVFGKKSVDAYQDAAKESMLLARQTGLTTKAASQLRFAGEESGVEFTKLSTGMKIFSKNLGATQGDSKKTAALVAQLGFKFKDAHGHILPMADLLPKVADRFKKMPDGPQKTAIAMKLFGRGGADMIKVLNKGSDGLKELAKESDKTGNTISNTDSYKKNIQAQREFHAAIKGLMITIGALLMPVITKLSLFMTEHVAPVFVQVSGFVSHHGDLIRMLSKILLPLIVAFAGLVKILRIFTGVMAAVNLVLDANPIGLVVLAIAALAAGFIYAYKHSETFRNIVNGVFKAVGKAASFMWNNVIKPVFKLWVNTWFGVVGALLNGAAKAFGWVPGVGGKLRDAASKFNDFRQHVNNQLDGVHKTVKITADTSDARKKVSAFVTFYKQQMASLPKNTHAGAAGGGGVILQQTVKNPHHARGSSYWTGGKTSINEEGRGEIVDLPRGARIIPAGLSAAMAGGGGGSVTVNVYGALDPDAVAKKVETVLAKLKRRRGKLAFED